MGSNRIVQNDVTNSRFNTGNQFYVDSNINFNFSVCQWQEIKEELKEQELFLKLVTNYLGTVDEEKQNEFSDTEEEHPPLTESKEDNLYTDFEEAP